MLQGLAGYFSPLVTFSARNSSFSCATAGLSAWNYHVACFDGLLPASYSRPPSSLLPRHNSQCLLCQLSPISSLNEV